MDRMCHYIILIIFVSYSNHINPVRRNVFFVSKVFDVVEFLILLFVIFLFFHDQDAFKINYCQRGT